MTGKLPTNRQKFQRPLELLRRKSDGKILPMVGRVPHDGGEYFCTLEDFLYWTPDGKGEMKTHTQWHSAELYEQTGYCGLKDERELE